MILEIDVGNSFIKWRLINKDQILDRGHMKTEILKSLPACWRNSIKEVWIASVASETVNTRLQQLFDNAGYQLKFAKVQAKQAGVTNSYKQIEQMGIDRWLAMLAAFQLCHTSCCIVDCGSAITIDYVAGDGKHQGGYIMPGLRLMHQGLLTKTANINVEQQQVLNLDLGTCTATAVSQGINYLFSSLAINLSQTIATDGNCKLYITGGDGEKFIHYTKRGQYLPELVMDGLKWNLS